MHRWQVSRRLSPDLENLVSRFARRAQSRCSLPACEPPRIGARPLIASRRRGIQYLSSAKLRSAHRSSLPGSQRYYLPSEEVHTLRLRGRDRRAITYCGAVHVTLAHPLAADVHRVFLRGARRWVGADKGIQKAARSCSRAKCRGSSGEIGPPGIITLAEVAIQGASDDFAQLKRHDGVRGSRTQSLEIRL